METRKSWEIPILNVSTLNELAGSRLPKKIDVFRHYLHLHKVHHLKVKDAKRAAVKAVCTFWEKCSIKTKKIDCGISEITKICAKFEVVIFESKSIDLYPSD